MLSLAIQEGPESLFSLGVGGLLPMAITLPLVILVLYVARRWVERSIKHASSHRLRIQVLLLVLTIIGLIAIILALPDGAHRDQLLSLLGLVLSAAIALSSTTFLGNMLAGFMVRSLDNLRIGDFLRVEGHFGRVTERGLFHTEIQTEDRDLTTIPNLILATHPMTVIRGSGTIINASVSLGYDVEHPRVEELLCLAAEKAGLLDPFVRIVGLGDFSVEYSVGGLLTEVKELLSRRTVLRRQMLDALHAGGIEIASPAILSSRTYAATDRFVPVHRETPSTPAGAGIEAVAFDKADIAESVESLREEIEALRDERRELEKRHRESGDATIKQALADELTRMELREHRLDQVLETRESELDDPNA